MYKMIFTILFDQILHILLNVKYSVELITSTIMIEIPNQMKNSAIEMFDPLYADLQPIFFNPVLFAVQVMFESY